MKGYYWIPRVSMEKGQICDMCCVKLKALRILTWWRNKMMTSHEKTTKIKPTNKLKGTKPNFQELRHQNQTKKIS